MDYMYDSDRIKFSELCVVDYCICYDKNDYKNWFILEEDKKFKKIEIIFSDYYKHSHKEKYEFSLPIESTIIKGCFFEFSFFNTTSNVLNIIIKIDKAERYSCWLNQQQGTGCKIKD